MNRLIFGRSLRLLVIVAATSILLAGLAALAVRWIVEPGAAGGKRVGVLILPGTSGGRIASLLQDKQVIDSAAAFRIYLKLKGVNQELKAGEYDLRKHMSFGDLVTILEKGPAVKFVKLVIPEGLNVDQTATRVGRETGISKEDFLRAATSSTILPAILTGVDGSEVLPSSQPGTVALEGFLFPKTYYVSEQEAAPSLVKRLVQQFEKETQDQDWSRSSQFGLTPYQSLVIASMIEREAKVDEERSTISAVIHNRLRLGMKLDVDATVQFLTNKYHGEPLTKSDLNIDSPYNTRRYRGIPPGPIASPGVASVAAALNPSNSDALYYVLTSDCRHHFFTANYRDFQNAAAKQPRNC